MKRHKTGLLLAPDDLELGRLVAIYDSQEFHDLRGASLKITAINLPFVVAKLIPRPDCPPITLNVADCTFMSVTEQFAAAQAQPIPVVPPSSDIPPNQG